MRDRIFKAMDEAIANTVETTNKEKVDVRNSFAGIGAETADMHQLNVASDMMDEGIDEETILASTGWFKGLDNKWKFEISDNDLVIFKDGNAKFLYGNPDFKRYNELMDKIFFKGDPYTDEEFEELGELEDKVLLKTQDYGNLSDFIKHDKLFEAYLYYMEESNISALSVADARNYIGGQAKDGRNMNTLVFRKVRDRIEWKSEMYEEMVTSLLAQQTGKFIFQPTFFQYETKTMVKNVKGGMEEIYNSKSIFNRSAYVVMYHPDCVSFDANNTGFKLKKDNAFPKLISSRYKLL
jgi:hypothetical protein